MIYRGNACLRSLQSSASKKCTPSAVAHSHASGVGSSNPDPAVTAFRCSHISHRFNGVGLGLNHTHSRDLGHCSQHVTLGCVAILSPRLILPGIKSCDHLHAMRSES
eukprot:6192915-Amphidinium_carterae.2